ncbi:hypothetical protein KDW36_15465 [Burkholderia dolosa]|uniref:hypothetical protein n=1 Tax=Burkholderia dolosa TaxID=152500 RepID=UPI001B93FB00|nr:hypothetical protein [Burkholderia dolosa]MBR8314584.1 hypothetical protein [Burkholderia dolosa]
MKISPEIILLNFNHINNSCNNECIREILSSNDRRSSKIAQETRQLFQELDRINSTGSQFSNVPPRLKGHSKKILSLAILTGSNLFRIVTQNSHQPSRAIASQNTSIHLLPSGPQFPYKAPLNSNKKRVFRRDVATKQAEDGLHLREERRWFETASEMEVVSNAIKTIEGVISHAKNQPGEEKYISESDMGAWKMAKDELLYCATERSRSRDFRILADAEAAANDIIKFISSPAMRFGEHDLIAPRALQTRDFVDFLYSERVPATFEIIGRAVSRAGSDRMNFFYPDELRELAAAMRSLPSKVSEANKEEWRKWGVDESRRHLTNLQSARGRIASRWLDFDVSFPSKEEQQLILRGLNTAIMTRYKINAYESKKCYRAAEINLTSLMDRGRNNNNGQIVVDAKIFNFAKNVNYGPTSEMQKIINKHFPDHGGAEHIILDRSEVSRVIKELQERQQGGETGYEDEWLGVVVD